MKKIEELIEKKATREEAKKLLTDEEFEEFERISEMREVLSSMKLEAPDSILGKVLDKAGEKNRHTEKRFLANAKFRIVFASIIVIIFAGIAIASGTIPGIKLYPKTGNSVNSNTNRQKAVSPEDTNQVRMFNPVLKNTLTVFVKSESEKENANKVITRYCGNTENGLCTLSKEKLDAMIKELKKYGTIRCNTGETENGSVIKIKVEVIVR